MKTYPFSDRSKYNEYGSLLTKRNNEAIDATGADFRMIVGRRSNGKTYPTIVFNGVKRFIDSNYTETFAYIRRWGDDLVSNASDIFNGCTHNRWLEWYTGGKWNDIYYYRRCWYLRKLDDNGDVIEKCKTPMAYGFSINQAERYKGPDYPTVKTIVFDEFIPEKVSRGYIPGEMKLWKSILSTIIRERSDVIVYMIANTIGKSCPYFDAYKIDIDEIEAGTITNFKYRGGGTLALEYCQDSEDYVIDSSKYFEIDDDLETGSMITRGEWETDLYPKLPEFLHDYKSRTKLKFFIENGRGKLIQGNILETDGATCIYFHRKTTPLMYKRDDYVYKTKWDEKQLTNPLIRIGFNSRYTLDKIILQCVDNNRCFYDENDTGEKLKHFIKLGL